MAEPILPRNFTPSITNSTEGLSVLFAKARHTNALNKILKKHLSAPFNTQLYLASIQQTTAIFTCHSPAIAFRAKQQSQTILASLQSIKDFQTVTEIQIKVLSK